MSLRFLIGKNSMAATAFANDLSVMIAQGSAPLTNGNAATTTTYYTGATKLTHTNSSSFSLSFYFRGYTDNIAYNNLFFEISGGTSTKGIEIYHDVTGYIHWYIRGGVATLAWKRTNNTFADGAWHQVVCVFDTAQAGSNNTDKMLIYVDGSVQATTTLQNNGAFDFTPDQYPELNNSGGTACAIELDDVAEFNIALSAPQVSTLYNAGVPIDIRTLGINSNLLHWWWMGDGPADSIDTLYDIIGSCHMTRTGTQSAFSTEAV